MDYIKSYFSELLELTNEMSPYLLLGFLFAGILSVYLKQQRISKFMGGKNFGSVFNSTMLGIPLPLCSCGVIPTGVSLYKNSASKSSTVSFLISTPQTGIDSILVTYSMLGWPFAILRPIVALVTGLMGGLFNIPFDKDVNIKEYSGESRKKTKQPKFIRMLNYAFVEFLQDISKWLIIGLLFAALISVLVPDNFFESNFNHPFLGMLIILAVSIPLYVCATGSVPIAAVLLMKGISPGAALVFLMAGPATNIATLTVLSKTIGKRSTIVYLLTIVLGAIGFGLLINQLPSQWFNLEYVVKHGHLLPEWLKIGSTLVLTVLLINGIIQKYLSSKKIKKEMEGSMSENVIIVKGMTCNHCKASVERSLNSIDGIDETTADINTSKVLIKGASFDMEKVKATIKEIGYEFSGIEK